MVEIGFQEIGLHKIYIAVQRENLKSTAIAKKLGFFYEKTSLAPVLYYGKQIDLDYYALESQFYRENIEKKEL